MQSEFDGCKICVFTAGGACVAARVFCGILQHYTLPNRRIITSKNYTRKACQILIDRGLNTHAHTFDALPLTAKHVLVTTTHSSRHRRR